MRITEVLKNVNRMLGAVWSIHSCLHVNVSGRAPEFVEF